MKKRKSSNSAFHISDTFERVKADLSEYIDKRAQKRHKKNYDIIYVCRNGKYKKFKLPHEIEAETETETDEENLARMVDEARKKSSVTDKKAKKAASKAVLSARRADLKRKAARWKHRHGDRIEGRRIKTANGMTRFMAFIMPDRNDALNTYADNFDITEAERYCRNKIKEGKKSFGMLYILLAAYIRVVSQRPAINRFISGQEIYSRYTINVVMTVKKSMAIDAPETCIKVVFEPTDTIDDVYRKFNKVVEDSVGEDADTDFDSFSGALQKVPRPLLRFFVWLINKLDYHGKLPLALLEISPFHGSMIITSMGSLGIKPIYHHIYNFGNLPVFVSYGIKRTVTGYEADGSITRRKLMDIKVVTDERICDGYYYASAFKMMKKLVENPEQLEQPPESVVYDID